LCLETGSVLEGRAMIHRVSYLRIESQINIIDVGDFEKLQVFAFDSKNNIFSTTEGLKFEWRVESSQSVKIVSAREAAYTATKKRDIMEASRLMTDICLVKGHATGIAQVIVSLKEDGYTDVQPAKIQLYVIEPFLLFPNRPIYVLRQSKLNFIIVLPKTQDGAPHYESNSFFTS
jgi:nuclear pore complex protein Nup210